MLPNCPKSSVCHRCYVAGYAICGLGLQVHGEPKTKWAPLPLSTLEMQKVGTQKLRVSGERIMTAAENLYQKGLISYPRTETDQFTAEDTFVRHPGCCAQVTSNAYLRTMQAEL